MAQRFEYEVQVKKISTSYATVLVTAEDEDEAERLAQEEGERTRDWEEQDYDVTVENISEVGPAEED